MTATVAARVRAGLVDLTDALASTDPGLIRLRTASRVTVTLVLVALAMLALHALVAALPPASYAIAMTLALQGALVVRDTTPRQRMITRSYSAVAGMSVLAVCTFLKATPALVDALFLAVAFVAVYARKWGPRWNAVGMFGFMACFAGAYFRPVPSDLVAIALALLIAGLIAHLVRDHLIADRPATDLRRALRAVDRRIGAVVSLIRAGQRGGWTPKTRRAAIAAQQRVKNAMILVEGLLPDEPGTAKPQTAAATLSIHLFDLNLALETALAAGFGATPGDKAAADRLMSSFDRLARLRRDARTVAGTLDDASLAKTGGASAPASPSPAATSRWRDPAFRLAVQVTLASAIAMAGGLMISTQRWFWAVLTAFLVFTNTQSRGDAAMRGLARASGTAIGIVAGIGLAALLHGELAGSLVLICACVFFGFFLVQASYGALTFFMTIALSLIYGLLGNFSPSLLVLRLEETLIGAAAGVFVSFFVFPQRTEATTETAVEAFLRELDRLLAAFEDRLKGETSPWRLVAIARGLDRRHAAIVAAVRPLDSGWLTGARRRMTRLGLLRFTVLTYWAHKLAAAGDDPADDVTLRAALEACRASLREALERGSDFFARAEAASLAPPTVDPRRSAAASSDPLLAAHAIRHILEQVLAGDMSAHGRI